MLAPKLEVGEEFYCISPCTEGGGGMSNEFGQNGFLVDIIRGTEYWKGLRQGISVLGTFRTSW